MGGDGELEPGVQITPALRLERRVGGGGMGAVWLAHHAGLDTKVIVKFIAPAIADSAVNVARFRREAAAAASVKSPHVVQMLDYGVTDQGRPYIVMELLVGRDLGDYLRENRVLPPHEVVQIVRQVCKALQRAHDLGIIHRDIKPENIFLCDHDDGEIFAKLLDFGIAKADDSVESVTTTGAAVGTPHYMSPEQAIGSKTLDRRSDLWSLGVLTYFLSTGRRPFSGETTGALTLAIFNGPIPRPSDANPNLPKAFDRWFAKACARDADARFSTARALANELSEALLGASAGPKEAETRVAVEPDNDPRSAATVKLLGGTPEVPASTLETAPTTERSVDSDVAPARTTAGIATGVSRASLSAVPQRSRAPVAIGVFIATVALGLGVYRVTRAPTEVSEPRAKASAPVEATPAPPSVEPPAATTAPIEPPPPTPSPSASAAPSIAPPPKPVKIVPPKPTTAPTATIKQPDEIDLK